LEGIKIFEVYKPRSEKVEKTPLISLSKNSIVLNKTSREKLNAESIELAFDRDTNTLRIKASPDGQTLKKTKMFARGFFNHFGINKKGKFPARYDEEENALYVNLNERPAI
jgi:hypothetical protein